MISVIPADPQQIIAQLQSGNRRIAARLISLIESGKGDISATLQALFQQGNKSQHIGITGPPGAGKSTIVDHLINEYRKRGESVAVLAVDPSSSTTGGAILGDRVRMGRHNTDAGVFIRSMSARGHLGGLSSAAGDALIVLGAMGFDRIIIETVGVGQSEIDILHHADTVVVVQTPIGGDNVQAMKAGLLEIADIFVLNKIDVSGADKAASVLREAIPQPPDHSPKYWPISIIKTQGINGIGITELYNKLLAHQRHLNDFPEHYQLRRERRCRALLIERVSEQLRRRHQPGGNSTALFEQQIQAILNRENDPASAARLILGEE
jgi:LAO/AO transport system kinase